MNNKFDELTKNMAQSVTRRQALKKFGVGLAGMALACFGLANIAGAGKVKTVYCNTDSDCDSGQVCCSGTCEAGIPAWCVEGSCCCYVAGKGNKRHWATALPSCDIRFPQCSALCINYGALPVG